MPHQFIFWKKSMKNLTGGFRKFPKWGWYFVVLCFLGAFYWIPKFNDLGIRISPVMIDAGCAASFTVSSSRSDLVSVEIGIFGFEVQSKWNPGGVAAKGKVTVRLAPNSEIQVKEPIWCQPFIKSMRAEAHIVKLTSFHE